MAMGTIGVGTRVRANRGRGSQFLGFANLLLPLCVLEDVQCLSLQGTDGLDAPY